MASSSTPSSAPLLKLYKLIADEKYGEVKTFLATPEGAVQAKRMYSKCNYGLITRSGVTMLHHALYTFSGTRFPVSSSPFEDCFKAIYHAFPEAVHKRDSSGYLPIHSASMNYATPLHVFKFLLNKNPSSVSQCDNSGSLPTHHICRAHSHQSSKFVAPVELFSLTKLGEEDNAGNLPIHLAAVAFSRTRDCTSAAVVYLARLFPAGLQHKNKTGCCPLHLVSDDAKFGELAELYPDCLSILNDYGETPLASYLASRGVAKCRIAVIQSVAATIASNNTGKDSEKALQDCQARLETSEADHKTTKSKLKAVSQELAIRKEIATQEQTFVKTARDMLLANEATPIETIKLIACSTKAHLDLLQAKLNKPDSKPTMVQIRCLTRSSRIPTLRSRR